MHMICAEASPLAFSGRASVGAVTGSARQDVMTVEVKYCFEDDDTRDVARNMAEIQVRRPPIVNRNKRLVGSPSQADRTLRPVENEPDP
jgi:CBS domain-containing protein